MTSLPPGRPHVLSLNDTDTSMLWNYGQPHLSSTMMTGNASHDEGNASCLHNKDPSIDVR